MSKPKRVSLQGKGAAIFFGEYIPTPPSSIETTQKPQQATSLPSHPTNKPRQKLSPEKHDEPTK